MGRRVWEGALSSLPVDDLRGAGAARGIGPHRLLSLRLRGEIKQMSAGVWRGVDLVSGAPLKETEEKNNPRRDEEWIGEERKVR